MLAAGEAVSDEGYKGSDLVLAAKGVVIVYAAGGVLFCSMQECLIESVGSGFATLNARYLQNDCVNVVLEYWFLRIHDHQLD